ncbi:hypothetical protein ACJMK2_042592 [Sinanodonta woodiana]|uniref:General transcription factor 3C polypeptide 3 n=1 Tax=Sinanodonta woodiana TaxID=1069815 RepID=A0ABD3W7U1_SINWO
MDSDESVDDDNIAHMGDISVTNIDINKESAKNPFQCFESYVSEEQWATWQEMNKQVKGLVEMSDSEDEEEILLDDTLLLDPSALVEVVSKKPNSDKNDAGRPSTSGVSPSSLSKSVPLEPTLEYLSGKITFLEFIELMEKASHEELGVLEMSSQTESGKLPTEQSPASDKEEDPDRDGDVKKKKKEQKQKELLKPRKERKKHHDLPRHLEGEMGDVNLTFARGDHVEAISKCLEIIRQAPQACKPFQTLGVIYESMGDMEKALQYFLIAAYLNPRDSEEWARLAELALELNDVNQAVMCYSNAIKFDRNNVDYLWERAKLYEEIRDFKKALESYQAILPLLPNSDSEQYFKLASSVARSHYENGDRALAVQTLRKAFEKHPSQITSEDVNLLLELQMQAKFYLESIEVLVNHCGVAIQFEDGREWSSSSKISTEEIRNIKSEPPSCTVSELLPIDLCVKLAVCMIHQHYHKLVKTVLAPLFEEDIEVNGDLFLDVAEAYMENGYYFDAMPLLGKLVKTTNYNLAAVWLKYADCLKCLGDADMAVQAYTQVVEMAPGHIGARMSLSALQQQRGKHKEALEALEQGVQQEPKKLTKEEQELLVQKCHLLRSQGKIDEFLESAKHLLFEEVQEFVDRTILTSGMTYKYRKEVIKERLLKKGLESSRFDSIRRRDQYKDKVPIEDLWDIFMNLCKDLVEAKRYDDFEEVTINALVCPQFQEDSVKAKEIDFMCVLPGVLKKNSVCSYNLCKQLLLENFECKQMWNLFQQVVMASPDGRHIRFCLRKLLQYPDNIPLGILNGHNSMVTGSYKHSLGEYIAVFRQTPMDPMLSLCIGLNFIHCASQKFAAKRHSLVAQGLMFLNNYRELRGECQEVYYNIGRALHQLGLVHIAIHYYNKALQMPPAIQDNEKCLTTGSFMPEMFGYWLIYARNVWLLAHLCQKCLATGSFMPEMFGYWLIYARNV